MDRKRELAAYYTPPSISEVLCSMAIKKPDELILEPSFGGCSFLESSWNALSKVGSKIPHHQIYGCDVDTVAFKNLKKNFPNAVPDNFVRKDFLKSSLSDFNAEAFTTVIGNPPFLPVDKLPNKELAWGIAKDKKVKLSKKSSLWAYFILHSMSFLRVDGNLYFVVPDSLNFTDYGSQLISYLKTEFKRVTIIRFHEQFFKPEGTPEKTSFLLCEGYKNGTENIFKEYNCQSVSNFNFQDLDSNKQVQSELKPEPLAESSLFRTCKLSEIAECKIGIVTGANDYLLRDADWLLKNNVPRQYYYPILSKSSELVGIEVSKRNLRSMGKGDNLFYLLDFKKMSRYNKKLYKRLKRKIPQEVLNNATFKYRMERREWFAYDDFAYPDMFLSYHTAVGPKLVINSAGVNTTNSLHRIYLKRGYKNIEMKKLIAISSMTSLSRNSAENRGRRYGSGILKLEPGGAKELSLAFPMQYSKKDLDNVFAEVDQKVRLNKIAEAVSLADKFILGKNN